MLAPIALFVFNRPMHTKKTLEALANNAEARNSELYIFCDGPKAESKDENLNKINEVIEISKSENRFKKINVCIQEKNLGLSKSIINGVTQVIEKHGKVIVLEDDILVGNYFLKFINKGLNLYQDKKDVYGVTGYCFPSSKKIKDSTYFLPIMSSWGYATWEDRWATINFNGYELLKNVSEKGLDLDFGYLNYNQMLKDQVLGKNDSWAVRFYASMYLNKGVFLFPNLSLLQNIGLDGTGVHCLSNSTKTEEDTFHNIINIDIVKTSVYLKDEYIKIIKKGKLKTKDVFMRSIKKKIKKVIAPEIIQFVKRKFKNKQSKELARLSSMPRFTKTKTQLQGNEISLPDGASYGFMYNEIFEQNIYQFKTTNLSPYIIDGGANIGLATIYFKSLYPEAKIVSFEPDSKIYDILKTNIESFGFKNVDLINKGIWNKNTTLSFKSEGADAGLISTIDKVKKTSEIIEVTPLKPFLQQQVDFLKLDIEGSETIVLRDIVDELKNVERIFVEYHSMIGQPQTLNEIIEILTKAKFRLYMSIPGDNPVNSPFMGLRHYNNMDLQLNIFGYKEN